MFDEKSLDKYRLGIRANMPNSPIGIIRQILRSSRSMGSISFSYHVAPSIHSKSTAFERTYFTDRKAFSKTIKDPVVLKAVKLAHDEVIRSGLPESYKNLLERFKPAHSAVAKNIEDRIRSQGIFDEYIVPVFGPYKIEGCMCYGFDQETQSLANSDLDMLQQMSILGHHRIVASFRDRIVNIKLSKRELQVLRWMSMGKTKQEIAVISGLKETTVNTYTQRIYTKFQVHSKVGAVLAAIASNAIKL